MDTTLQSGRTRVAAILGRGLLCGAVTGLVVGLLDALISILGGNELVGPADALHVTTVYGAYFAPCGLVAALIAVRLSRPHRGTALMCVGGGAIFLVLAFVNVGYLPGFVEPQSLVFDVVLFVAVIVWARRAYGRGDTDRAGWVGWVVTGATSLLVAGLLLLVGTDRDGPAVSARARRPEQRPNVLVYMVDTLRADALSCYGYGKATSPEIDAFARDAVLFTDCRAPAPWTKPSVASLFTSLYPTQHACMGKRDALVPAAETLAEVLGAAGWRTAAFVDNLFISPEFGFGQGFEYVDAQRPSVIASGTFLGRAMTMAAAISRDGEAATADHGPNCGAGYLLESGLIPWIDAVDERPWFAYVHTMEPHAPYSPRRDDAEAFGLPRGTPYRLPPFYTGVVPFSVADEPAANFVHGLRAQYDGEVRDTSRWFGRTIDALRTRGLLDETIIVFVADHGEEFYDHGGWTHQHSLHRELLHVPLIIRVPDAMTAPGARGLRVQGVASLLDIFPTLLDLCDVHYPKGEAQGVAGTSLEACVRGDTPTGTVPVERVLLAELTSGPTTVRSLRDSDRHYIRARQPLQEWDGLYDLLRDPDELRDVKRSETVEHARMSTRLDELFAALAATALTGERREIDADTAETLRSIGYIDGE